MWRLVFAFLLAVPVAQATDMPAGIGVAETSAGTVFVDARGMTLYTFTEDSQGKSVCYGTCAKNWPPLTAPDGAAAISEFSLIARDDGTRQWAYKGMPLYLWVRDAKPGDVTGDRYREIWHVAKP